MIGSCSFVLIFNHSSHSMFTMQSNQSKLLFNNDWVTKSSFKWHQPAFCFHTKQPWPVQGCGWRSNTQDFQSGQEASPKWCLLCCGTVGPHRTRWTSSLIKELFHTSFFSCNCHRMFHHSLETRAGCPECEIAATSFSRPFNFQRLFVFKCSSICGSSEKRRDLLRHFQYNELKSLDFSLARISDLSDQLAAISAGVPDWLVVSRKSVEIFKENAIRIPPARLDSTQQTALHAVWK